MSYELLNLNDNDILTSEHIRHLENGIKEIENSTISMKQKLVSILKDKQVDASDSESISDIVKKFTYLKNASPIDPEYGDLIDIRETVESGQVQLVVTDISQSRIYITSTTGFIVDWGDSQITQNASTTQVNVTHTYTKGSGQPYDGTNTQFVITIKPIGDGKITGVKFPTSGTKFLQSFASKDVYFTNLTEMFQGQLQLKYIDLIGGSFGTSDTQLSMDSIFYNCPMLKRITGSVCWTSITSLKNAFNTTSNLQTLDLGEVWDTRNVTDFCGMFANSGITVCPEFKTDSATTMESAFSKSKIQIIKGNSWNLSNCTTLANTFFNCTSLTTVPCFINTNGITTAATAFNGCTSLERLNENQIEFDLSSATNCESMFSGCISLYELPTFILTSATNVGYMFRNCSSLVVTQECFDLPSIVGATSVKADGTYQQGVDGLFEGCSSLIQAPQINVPNASTARALFKDCSNLITVPSYSFPKAINVCALFNGCISLKKAPESLELPKAKYVQNLFDGCTSLITAPYSNDGEIFDLPEVLNANRLFYNCTSMQIPPNNMNLPKATNVSQMFTACRAMQTSPKNMNIDSATDITYLFSGTTSLAYPPEKISAKSATNASNLFNNCSALLECPELDLPVATKLEYCFAGCLSLTTTIPYYFPKASSCYGFFYNDITSNLSEVEEIKTDVSGCNFGKMISNAANLTSITYPRCTNGNVIGEVNANASALKYIKGEIDMTNAYLPNLLASQYLEGTLTFKNVKSTLTIDNKPFITGIRFVNPSSGIANQTFTNCALDADALNLLFEDLPTVSATRTINVKGNPGAATCDTSIATQKNWKVTIA